MIKVPAERGVSIIQLPNGKVALVVVEVLGPRTAARMAKALIAGTTPTAEWHKAHRKAKG